MYKVVKWGSELGDPFPVNDFLIDFGHCVRMGQLYLLQDLTKSQVGCFPSALVQTSSQSEEWVGKAPRVSTKHWLQCAGVEQQERIMGRGSMTHDC